jgi:tripartite-type tricarboxylate transporter receptor subunit TctC
LPRHCRDTRQGPGRASARPKGTPAAVIARLDREIGAALAEPTIEARLADLGTVPMPLNAQEFAAFIAAESEKWGKVVRLANIAPQ